MIGQINIFEISRPKYKIKKPIRLIELFAGIGSQAKALKNIGANFEHYRIVEFDKYAIASYNAIHGTNFETLDITKITGKDLGIVETDKYVYIMTYSFPCQDLSLAGKGAGMKKGSGTRSGLLWEVEYLLSDLCGFKEHRVPPRNSKYLPIADWVDDYNYDIDKSKLPQILLMENVPQVIGKKNLKDFREWQLFLEKLGYSNYFELLNAKDFGIPQNRNRCFMVSLLGDYYYQFPRKQKLKYRLKDFLEDEVDEKYYLSEKLLKCFLDNGTGKYPRGERFEQNLNRPNQHIANAITGNPGNRATDNFILKPVCLNSKVNGKQPSLQDRVYDSKGISTAITTSFMPSIVVKEPTIAASRGRNIENPSDRTKGIELEQRLELNKEGLCNTITTVQKDNYLIVPETPKYISVEDYESGKYEDFINRVGMLIEDCDDYEEWDRRQHITIKIPEATKKGYAIAVKKETGNTSKLRQFDKNIYIDEFNRAFIKIGNMFYRIRKLTPKECWRLMGFSDEDYDKASKVNSNRQLYKQAGNAIVVQVLEAIFKVLIE